MPPSLVAVQRVIAKHNLRLSYVTGVFRRMSKGWQCPCLLNTAVGRAHGHVLLCLDRPHLVASLQGAQASQLILPL